MVSLTTCASVFACYSAACRPPTSGGTGGSGGKAGASGGAGQIKDNAVFVGGTQVTGKIRYSSGPGGDTYTARLRMNESFRGPGGFEGSRRAEVWGATKQELVDAVMLRMRRIETQRTAQAAKYGAGPSAAPTTSQPRSGKLSLSQQRHVYSLGKTTPKDVVIGRDGSVKVNGWTSEVHRVKKGADNGTYAIEGLPDVFKSQSATKAFIAREVNSLIEDWDA